jgi:hypothetical protein
MLGVNMFLIIDQMVYLPNMDDVMMIMEKLPLVGPTSKFNDGIPVLGTSKERKGTEKASKVELAVATSPAVCFHIV